jgi:hypothetical protein
VGDAADPACPAGGPRPPAGGRSALSRRQAAAACLRRTI